MARTAMIVLVVALAALAVDARMLLDHGTHHNAPPVLKPPQPKLSFSEKQALVAEKREHAAHRNNAVLPGAPGSNVAQTVTPVDHNCPPGYHIMGDHRGGVGLDGRAKYWCMLNDGIYKMGDFQKTLNPEGVDTVKTAVGFNSQTTMKQARVDAENNNVNARSEQKRVETIGQDKTASIIADADDKMAKAKSELI